jgi:DNA-binding IclR family transcriptional regulator
MKKGVNQENQTAYKSISRAAEILSCLRDGKNSVTEIAQYCELSKPTVSRLLQALEKSNLSIRDPVHRKYFIGSLLNLLVANPKTTHLNLITLSMEEMNRLSKMCGETIILGVLVGIQNIRLHMIPSIHNIRVYDDDNFSLTSQNLQGAAIKATLSQLERRELASVMDHIQSKSMTKNSGFDKKQFLSQLNQIREQGYAMSRGEKFAGALAISVPVKRYHLPAALSVVGIESRIESKVPELLPEILASSNRISSNLRKST